MAQPSGFGSFDPTLTTRFGPTGTEDIEALEAGLQRGFQQGQQIAQIIQAGKRFRADQEKQKQLDDIRAVEIFEQHKLSQEKLNFPDEDDNVDGLSNARAEVSNMLVDKSNKLYQAYERGEISMLQLRQGQTILESQIPLYKTAEETLRVNAEKYLEGVTNNTLSGANDPKVEAFYSAVANNKMSNFKFEQGKNGQIKITGSYDYKGETIPVNVPLKDIDSIGKVRYKPSVRVDENMSQNLASIVTAKINDSLKNGSEQSKLGDELQLTQENKNEIRPLLENSFDDYMESLGEGNEQKKLEQYLLDGGAENYFATDAVLSNVLKEAGLPDKSTIEDMDALFSDPKYAKYAMKLKQDLKENYIARSEGQYNLELAKQLGEKESARLKQAGADALNQQRIVSYKEQIKEIKSPKKDGPKYNIEKDLDNLINNLTGGEGEIENLLRNINAIEPSSVITNLSKFNLKANTTQKDNPKKGGKPIQGIKISGPGMKPIDFYGTDFTDITQLTKDLLYGQEGISRKDKDAIWSRLTDKYKL